MTGKNSNKSQSEAKKAMLLAKRIAKAEGGLLSSIFSGKDYQSTGEELVDPETKQIRWGSPESAADYARAAAEVARRQREEEAARKKADAERIEVTPLPPPKPTDIADFSRRDFIYPEGQRPADLDEPAPVPVQAARDVEGSPRAWLPWISSSESGNIPTKQNPLSSAGGLYQFITPTWVNVLRRMDPQTYGSMSTAQLAPLRKSPDTVALQHKAAQFHLENDILPTLQKAQIPINPATVYLGWFQGPAGAVRAWNAPGDTPIAKLFPDTLTANANVRYRGKYYPDWTRNDLINWVTETMAAKARSSRRADGGRTGYADEGAVTERPTLDEALLGKGAELPSGDLTLSAPTEVPWYQRAWNALPSPSTYGRALEEELHAPRQAIELAKQIARENPRDLEATKLSALGTLGYAMAPISAAQNVLIRDPILKAGGSMERAERGVNVSDALGVHGAVKAAAKKAAKTGISELAKEGKNVKFLEQVSPQAQVAATGYLGRSEKAVGGSNVQQALKIADEATPKAEKISFLGKRAKLTPSQLKQLGKAERRLEGGEDPERVRRLHGWTSDPSGKMMYELSDKGAKLRPEGLEKFRRGEQVTLGELMEHPALFDAYPSSFSRPVRSLDPRAVQPEQRGWYDHYADVIASRRDLSDKDLLDNLLHEHQHRIQTVEGFSPGQSPALFKGPDVEDLHKQTSQIANTVQLYNYMKQLPENTGWYDAKQQWLKSDRWKGQENPDVPIDFNLLSQLQGGYKTPDELMAQRRSLIDEILKRHQETPSPYDQYYRSLGEVTARKPGERIEMSDLERRRTAPITPQDEVIVRPPMKGPMRENPENLDWDIFKNAIEHAAELREPPTTAYMPFQKGGKAIKGNLREMLSKFEKKPETVKLPSGEIIPAKPIPEIEAAAEGYMRGIGRPGEEKIDDFVSLNPAFASAVAKAFQEMKHNPKDPEIRRAYDALIDETLAQYRALKDTGIDFRFLREGQADPYAKSPAMGYEDILKHGRLFVFPTEQGFGSSGGLIATNPLLKNVGRIGDLPDATANDAFRIVHDAYGHFGPGNPFFRAPGEERAYQLHSRMYSPEALPAMTSETRGQNSWVNFGPNAERNLTASGADTVYADQKIGKLPDWALGSPDDPEVVKKALQYLNAREDYDKGGTALKKALKSSTAQVKKIYPEMATRYPEVAQPVEAVDPKSGNTYLAKALSDEAKAIQIARKAAQQRIDRGEWTPFFNPAERFDVDPANYPPYISTLTQRRVKPETQQKYDSMLMADDVLNRLDAAYKRGLMQKEDAENWYMLGQVEREFINEYGPEVGRAKFKEKIADAMAATTGGADPEANWLMAHYGNWLKEKGAEMPTAAYEFPFPIGGRFVAGNMDQYRKMIMEGEGVTPENPKRYNFSQNFLGNKGATIDEQMMGIIRPGTNVPEPGTYGHHEAPVVEMAAREGVDPRYYQEVAWAGRKDEKTKGGYKAQPFVQTLNESIERTSQVTGLPPKEVVRRGLVRSEIPMYGAAGATIGAEALSEPKEEIVQPEADGGKVYPLRDHTDWEESLDYEKSGGKLTHMSPDEFLKKTKPLKNSKRNRRLIDHFKKRITDGVKLDPLAIYEGGGQNGRHRATAAKELGIEEVPVFVSVKGRPKKATGGFSSADYANMYYNGLPKLGMTGQILGKLFPNPATTGAYDAYMNQFSQSAGEQPKSEGKTPEFDFKPVQPAEGYDLASLNFEPSQMDSGPSEAPVQDSVQQWKNLGTEKRAGGSVVDRALMLTSKKAKR